MPKLNIASVCFEFPADDVEFIPFTSDRSLLDFDLIVFEPSYSASYYSTETYQGKACFSETQSFKIKGRSEHWRRELLTAYDAGKTVIVFLPSLDQIFVDTGQRNYSGTGRNRQTTRMVEPYDNYRMIPHDLRPVNSRGRSVVRSGDSGLLDSFWKRFSADCEYRVHLGGSFSQPLLKTKTGDRIVSAFIRGKAGGTIVFLPYLDFEGEEYVEEDDDSESGLAWTQKAVTDGAALVSELVAIHRVHRQTLGGAVEPPWVSESKYLTDAEARLTQELLQLEKRLQELQDEKEKISLDLADAGSLKALLYETGKPLEAAILKALDLIGFKSAQYQDSESEFDVVFEAAEGRFLGEAEGKEKAISIDKLRQLEMNIHEDFARDDVEEMASGVLFGNAHRMVPPDQRPDFFTTKCLTAASRSGTALVRTPDLYEVARYLSGANDTEYASQCRAAILKAKGTVVDFPNAPDSDQRRRSPKKAKRVSKKGQESS